VTLRWWRHAAVLVRLYIYIYICYSCIYCVPLIFIYIYNTYNTMCGLHRRRHSSSYRCGLSTWIITFIMSSSYDNILLCAACPKNPRRTSRVVAMTSAAYLYIYNILYIMIITCECALTMNNRHLSRRTHAHMHARSRNTVWCTHTFVFKYEIL